MLEQLLAHLRDKSLEKKPTVDELKTIDAFKEVNATLRDEAWKTYQEEQKKEADAANSETSTTTTTDTTDEDAPTHSVTVKRDGFRRCGRAWQGTEEVKLSAEEVEILSNDADFVVVEL